MGVKPIAVDSAQAYTATLYTPEPEASDSIARHDDWAMSFTDLLLLLLTLFVLLLSFKNGGDTTKTAVATTVAATNTAPQVKTVVPQNTLETALPMASTADNSPASLPETETNPTLKPQDIQAMMINDIFEKLNQGNVQQDAAHNEVQISATTDSINLEINEAILFAPANDDLTARGKQVLQQLAEVFVDYPFRLSVEGHTDNIPIKSSRFPSNWELSTSRATKVTRMLIDYGYPSGMIRSVGYGDTQPLADNNTTEGRAKNRRVSIVIKQPGANISKSFVSLPASPLTSPVMPDSGIQQVVKASEFQSAAE